MDLSNVYIGYTKDGKERCLYKKNRAYSTSVGIVNATIYEDIETNEEFELSFVDVSSLMPCTYGLDIQKSRMTRRKVKKIYQADRNKLIDVKGVFFGNIVEKYALRKKDQYYNDDVETTLKENILFARIYDTQGRVMNLKNQKLYQLSKNVSLGIAAKEQRSINYQQFDKQMQPKRKVLEKAYRKEL